MVYALPAEMANALPAETLVEFFFLPLATLEDSDVLPPATLMEFSHGLQTSSVEEFYGLLP